MEGGAYGSVRKEGTAEKNINMIEHDKNVKRTVLYDMGKNI